MPWHTGDARMAWYYYDGVRRVQEVFRDPLPPGSLAGNPNPIGSYTTYTDREYVWGPGYVDECLWQIDRTGAAAFVLQDANFNVVALIDETGQVLQQFDYDPYGSVRELDEPAAYADNRVGFQGLFADRFDADAPHPEMAVGADQTYYARNRDYRPDLGRWMQRDPNGTALTTVRLAGRFGFASDTLVDTASPRNTYRDGMNGLASVASNPVVRIDPTGRFFGYGDLAAANAIRGLFISIDVDAGLTAIDAVYGIFDPVRRGVSSLERYLDRVVGDGAGETFTTIASVGLYVIPVARGRALGPIAPALTNAQKKALRKDGRDRFKTRTGWDLPSDIHIHHRVPLEWAHYFPLDPNHLSNIFAVQERVHSRINTSWAAWKRGLDGRAPTKQEILQQVQYIDNRFGTHKISAE